MNDSRKPLGKPLGDYLAEEIDHGHFDAEKFQRQILQVFNDLIADAARNGLCLESIDRLYVMGRELYAEGTAVRSERRKIESGG